MSAPIVTATAHIEVECPNCGSMLVLDYDRTILPRADSKRFLRCQQAPIYCRLSHVKYQLPTIQLTIIEDPPTP